MDRQSPRGHFWRYLAAIETLNFHLVRLSTGVLTHLMAVKKWVCESWPVVTLKELTCHLSLNRVS